MRRGPGSTHVQVAATAVLLSIGCTVETGGLAPIAPADADAGADAAPRDAWVPDTAIADAFVPDVPLADAAGGPDCMMREEACNGLDDDCDGVPDDEGCPCDALTRLGKVYLFCTAGAEWHAARGACEALDGFTFVSIESADEDGWLWSEARARRETSWWIGLHEPAPGVYAWTDGTEVWNHAGATSAYHNFAGGMPEYSVPDDCGQLSWGASGRWDEGRCSNPQPYVCEASGT